MEEPYRFIGRTSLNSIALRTLVAQGRKPQHAEKAHLLEIIELSTRSSAPAALEKCCADNRMPADDDRGGVGAAAPLFPGLGDAVRIIAEPGRRAGCRQVHIGSVLSEPP